MTNNDDRLDRIQRILEEMAARQQYHDEAFERFDADMRIIKDAIDANTQAIAANTENIRGLVRVAELHHERLNRLEGDQPE